MKKIELEQLRKDINARIDAIINKPEEFVKGKWYYLHGCYAKYDKEANNFGFLYKGVTSNTIDMKTFKMWQPVTDFTELTEFLKAEVIKRIGKGKPIGVRDVESREMNKFYSDYKKDYANLLGEMTDYNPDTDTLYAIGYGITIVYENGVFATDANEENLNHNKEHVTNELINLGFVKGCSFKFEKDKGIINSSGKLDFDHFNEDGGWTVYIDCWYVYANGKYATIINPMQAKLEEAKLKYPIGTEFKCLITGDINKVTKIEIGRIETKKLYDVNSSGIATGKIYDGDTDTWATIIQEPIIIDGKEVEIEKNCCFVSGIWYHIDSIRPFRSISHIFKEMLSRMENNK